MTKLSYMIKNFQIDEKKRLVNFTISVCKAFTLLIFKYDMSEYRNTIEMAFFGNKPFYQ